MEGASDDESVKLYDPDGCEMNLTQIDGVYSIPKPGVRQRVAQLQKFQGRDDDIIIAAYPKSGTQWTWEITQLLSKNQTENIVDTKMKEFIEYADLESIDKAFSPRILNTHLRPRFFPPDSINRKCKIIYVVRNPKDVMVSFYHHCQGQPVAYGYHGSFSGFFHLAMSGQVESGSWFDYTLEHEEFFRSRPDIPVLRLHYEDMKKDLLSNVRRIADFCDYRASEETIRGITDVCTFSNMKTVKTKIIDPVLGKVWRDGKYNMFRKGVSGDWKNYFTVAQNEQFEEEAARRLAGSDVEVRWVN